MPEQTTEHHYNQNLVAAHLIALVNDYANFIQLKFGENSEDIKYRIRLATTKEFEEMTKDLTPLSEE